jgi:hypothetical protein
MLSFIEWFKNNRATLALLVASILILVRPFLENHGIPATVIDQIIEALGLGGVALMRGQVPADNKGKTYSAVGVGLASLIMGNVGLLSPAASLTAGAAMLGLSGVGLHSAVKRS